MKISEYYNEFLGYLSAEKNASHYTIENYLCDFKIFAKFLATNGIEPDLCSINTPLIRKYISYLKTEKKYKNQTIRRKIHSLSSFFNFAVEQEYITKNPMTSIHAPRREEKVPIYLSESEITKLIKSTMHYGNDNALRDKCIIETLAYTGIRRQELLGLDWEDVDFKLNTLKIRFGKGKKERIIPLMDKLVTDLWAYLQTRLPLTNHAVFISQTGNRMSNTSLECLFRKYLKKSGLEGKGYTIHKLRHSFASLLIQNNANLLSVKELLGHSDLNSTKIYTHINTNYLRQELNKLPFK